MDVNIYDKLAQKYDSATKIVSFGIEELWRFMFVREIKKEIKDGVLLDIASATGEMAKSLGFKKMYLIEPSEKMNEIAKKKLTKAFDCKVKGNILTCDKEIIILKDTAENFHINEKVDLITAFMAVRNFDNLNKGMENLKSHLTSGGIIAIVEMTKSNSIIAKAVMWYMNNVVPIIAGLLLGMKEEYKLLGKSINSLDESVVLQNLEGFSIIKKKKLIFDIATLIIAKKR